jgi:hypothetical protein
MGTQITSTFEVKSWDENPFGEEAAGLPKLTRASVTKAYSGDIDGASLTEWLMAYAEDGSASFVGLERITGTMAGRTGTMVLQHVGLFEDGAAKGSLTVVRGCGTDALASVAGAGDFLADPAGSVRLYVAFD